MSRFDQLYRSLLLTGFFTKGWGHPDSLIRLFEFRKLLSNRETCQKMVEPDYPIHIDKDVIQRQCRVIEGHFMSPLTQQLPGIMPKEVEMARFQMILPREWTGHLKPVCLHLAGTGDHYYTRRRVMLARPLLKQAGIASIILENPYYGVRKPKEQLRSSLRNVSDLFVMGGALVLESLALFHWCERQGYGPLGITGISMGGHMASLAATNWHKPVALIPCMSWSTASSVFTQGVLSKSIPWKLLEEQYFNDSIYQDEISKLINSPERNRANPSFQLGQDFARNYPARISEMESIHKAVSQEPTEKPLSSNCDLDNNGNESNHRDSDKPETKRQSLTNRHGVGGLNASGSAQYHTIAPTSEDRKKASKSRSGLKDRFNFTRKPKTSIQTEALDFMRGVMDECTHLGNFSVPIDPSLIIIVLAKKDAYVPTDSVLSLQELWPGAEVRYVKSGHIGAFLFRQRAFRKAIIDAFDRQIKLYYS